MSYLVLARKYRPRDFAAMVGQEHVVRALSNALESKRLHHAYLFTGTRGVGKTTVSRILAKALNCQGPDGQGGITAHPCGVCPACTDIDSGRFVDYTELDAASNRSVDEIQQLLEQAVYKPVQGRFKVFMIDEVHMLTGHAFNAMLKTLEEPPEYLKFVLATTDPQKVPVTVLSRCLQFNLRPMAPETVFEHLVQTLQQENIPAEEAALRLLARCARGSMRDALSLTDQAIAFGDGKIEAVAVRQMVGGVDTAVVYPIIEALAAGDGAQVVQRAESLRLHGLSAAATLEEMAAVLSRMAIWRTSGGSMGTAAGADDTSEVARLAALMPADETQLLYSICLHGRAELGLAPDEYVALIMVLLRLLAFKPAAAGATDVAASPAEKKSLIDAAPQGKVLPVVDSAAPQQVEKVAHDALAPRSRVPPADFKAHADRAISIPVRQQLDSALDGPVARGNAPVVRTEDGDFWADLVKRLVSRDLVTALVRELALHSQLVARDTDQWLLRVERETLNQAGSRDRLQGALQLAGHVVRVVVEVGRVTDSPARRHAEWQEQRRLAAEHIIFSDPLVQDMMARFGAKIVPGSIRAA